MYKIAVAGNPNSGKTCLFNQLTGSNQRVGNYPGVTVEFIKGLTQFDGHDVEVVDLPGTYSLTAYSQEEVVARNFIVDEKPDLIINVIDASNLERNLYLTTQLLELNVPVMLALNMVDVAEKKGHIIDAKRLGAVLGVKAVATIASRAKGLAELRSAAIATLQEGTIPNPVTYSHEVQRILPELDKVIKSYPEFCGNFPPRWTAVKLLEEDEILLKKLATLANREPIENALKQAKAQIRKHSNEDSATAIVESRYGFAAGAAREVTSRSEVTKQLLTDAIDSVVCNRFLGPVVLCAVVYLLFEAVFSCAEGNWLPVSWDLSAFSSPVSLLEDAFKSLTVLVQNYISAPWLRSLLSDGVIGGVGGVIGFVPLIFFMFFFIAILEDSGYIARVAFIMDRVMRSFGLQGKSILAMIVSGGLGAGGCAVPGVMATRTLREERDRLITILVAPFMNCGAKMPVYAMLIAAFFAKSRGAMMFLLWLISWCFALGSAFILRKYIIKGEQTPFVMELPVYHMPTFKGILMDTWHRTYMFIKKAATIILAINVIMWALMYYPRMDNTANEAQLNKYTAELQAKTKGTQYAQLFAPKCISATMKAYNNNATHSVAEVANLNRQFLQEFNQKERLAPYDKQAVTAFATYLDKREANLTEYAEEQLKYSFAGRLGQILSPITRLAGFSWRENISLIGGFAAKEVVLGTMGTAYSLGRDAEENPEPLSEIIQADKSWNKLRAFVFMIFVLAYAPCIVTLVTIKKETGRWRWALFSSIYSTVLAFVVAAAIYQIGLLFVR